MFLSKQDVKDAVNEVIRGGDSIPSLKKEKLQLQEQIETLKIEKARVEEGHARAQREVEHKVGLLKRQHEQENALTEKRVKLEVREENLKADRDRFEGQMKFHEEQMKGEVNGLRDLVAQLLERLPSMQIKARIGGEDVRKPE